MSDLTTAALIVVTVLGVGCKTKDPNVEELKRRSEALAQERAKTPPPSPAASLAEGRFPEETDVAPPAVDLADEVAAYTDAAGCAKRHRVTDPLVADGLEALGYDAFVRDGCRSIAALKEKDKDECAPILSTARRRACLADLAIATGDEGLCPTDEPLLHYPFHEASCLAGARRDVRPCAVLRGTERAACEGIVAHEEGRCGTDARCARRVARWRTLLPSAPGKSPYEAKIVSKLTFADESLDGGLRDERLTFADEAAAGAVIVTNGDTVRVHIGSPTRGFLDGARPASLGVAFTLAHAALTATKSTAGSDSHVALYEVGGLDLVAEKPPEIELTAPLPEAPNDPVRFVLRADVGPSNAPKRLEITVDTWLRDRVVVPKEDAQKR